MRRSAHEAKVNVVQYLRNAGDNFVLPPSDRQSVALLQLPGLVHLYAQVQVLAFLAHGLIPEGFGFLALRPALHPQFLLACSCPSRGLVFAVTSVHGCLLGHDAFLSQLSPCSCARLGRSGGQCQMLSAGWSCALP